MHAVTVKRYMHNNEATDEALHAAVHLKGSVPGSYIARVYYCLHMKPFGSLQQIAINISVSLVYFRFGKLHARKNARLVFAC